MADSDSSQQSALQSGSFVGRDRELQELRSGLSRMGAGRGGMFCIVGEAGIGKTRLAEEIASEASRSEYRVVWGRCWEGGGAPAFWPFIQIIRACAADLDRDTFASILSQTTLETLGLVLKETFEPRRQEGAAILSLPARSGAVSDAARFVLFDSIAAFFIRFAAMRPLVIVLDDIHAADVDSLMLLRFVSRELARSAILIVVTYRETEARLSPERGPVLASLGRDASMIHLGGLPASDIAAFVERTGLLDATQQDINVLADATEGNPFFLGETLRLLAADRNRKLTGEDLTAGLPIPDNVRETIRRRLAPLSTAAREVFEVAPWRGESSIHAS